MNSIHILTFPLNNLKNLNHTILKIFAGTNLKKKQTKNMLIDCSESLEKKYAGIKQYLGSMLTNVNWLTTSESNYYTIILTWAQVNTNLSFIPCFEMVILYFSKKVFLHPFPSYLLQTYACLSPFLPTAAFVGTLCQNLHWIS